MTVIVTVTLTEQPKRCIPDVITYEWFFNRRPPTKRRTRRGSRW